ncbi:MAG: COX15/CtaA family protein [Methanomassiliicoccales archaeon]
MEGYKKTALLSVAFVWIEFVIAAAVVFLDPGNNDFPYTKIVLTWPGVLEEIHRLWAALIILVFIVNLIVIHRSNSTPRHLMPLAIISFFLLLLQALYGAITIINYDYPPYVVLHEGNAGVLLMATALMAAVALYSPVGQMKEATPNKA